MHSCFFLYDKYDEPRVTVNLYDSEYGTMYGIAIRSADDKHNPSRGYDIATKAGMNMIEHSAPIRTDKALANLHELCIEDFIKFYRFMETTDSDARLFSRFGFSNMKYHEAVKLFND